MNMYEQGRQEAEETIQEYGVYVGTVLIEQTVSRMNHVRHGNMPEDEQEYTRGLWHRMQELTEGKTAEEYNNGEE